MDNDTDLLAEQVGRLSEQLKVAEEQNATLKHKMWEQKLFLRIANFWTWMIAVTAIGAVLFPLAYAIHFAIKTPDDPTHCYVSNYSNDSEQSSCPCFALKGSVDWGFDTTIGIYSTLEMTMAAAKAMKCPLRVTQPLP